MQYPWPSLFRGQHQNARGQIPESRPDSGIDRHWRRRLNLESGAHIPPTASAAVGCRHGCRHRGIVQGPREAVLCPAALCERFDRVHIDEHPKRHRGLGGFEPKHEAALCVVCVCVIFIVCLARSFGSTATDGDRNTTTTPAPPPSSEIPTQSFAIAPDAFIPPLPPPPKWNTTETSSCAAPAHCAIDAAAARDRVAAVKFACGPPLETGLRQ